MRQPNERSDFDVSPHFLASGLAGPEEMQRVTEADKLGMGRINFFGLDLNRLYAIRSYAVALKAEELIAVGSLTNPGNGGK